MRRGNARARVDASGRNSDRVGAADRFFMIRRQLLHSPQYSALSTNSRALMFELAAMFNGKNQDNVFLSVSDAAQRLGLADLKAASAAFHELAALGFITETIGASFRQKADAKARARAWRLNWLVNGKCGSSDVLPPLDAAKLAARQNRRVERRSRVLRRYCKDYSQGKFAVEDSSMLAVRRAFSVEDSSMLNDNNAGKPPIPALEDSSIHIEYHIPSATGGRIEVMRASKRGWADLAPQPFLRSPGFPLYCELVSLRRSVGAVHAKVSQEIGR